MDLNTNVLIRVAEGTKVPDSFTAVPDNYSEMCEKLLDEQESKTVTKETKEGRALLRWAAFEKRKQAKKRKRKARNKAKKKGRK